MPPLIAAAAAAAAVTAATTVTFATAFAVASTVISVGQAFIGAKKAKSKQRRARAAAAFAAKKDISQFLTQEPSQAANIIYGKASIAGNIFFKGFCDTAVTAKPGAANTEVVKINQNPADMEYISANRYYVKFDAVFQANNRTLANMDGITINDANTTNTAGDSAADITFASGVRIVETQGTNDSNQYEATDTNRFFYICVALAPHEVESIEEIYIGDKLVEVNSDGYVTHEDWIKGGEYSIKFNFHLGAAGQVADADLVKYFPKHWSTDHVGNGITYVTIRFLKKDVPDGIPNTRFVVKGKKVYDPRTSTTVWSDNWSLILNDYLEESELGLNVPTADIDQTTLIASANISDEVVDVRGYGDILIDSPRDLTDTDVWTPDDLTVTANADDGFDGETLADKLVENTVNGDHFINHTYDVVAGYRYEIQVKAKKDERKILTINHDAFVGDTKMRVDLDLGTIVDSATTADVEAIAESSNGYYMLTYIFTATSTTTATIKLNVNDDTGTESYQGVSGNGLYIDDYKFRRADQERYTVNGLVDTEGNLIDNIQQMVDVGAGAITYTEGSFYINPGSYEVPTVDIDEGWLRGDMTIVAKKARNELFNAVRGVFLDADQGHVVTDFPAVTNSTYETEDGSERLYTDIELPYVSDTYRAQRIGKILLERGRQGIIVEMPCNLYPLQLTAWQNVTLTNTALGWSNKVFKVMRWNFNADGGIDLLLQEEASTSYDWNDGEATVIDSAPNTNLPDPSSTIDITGLTLDSGADHLFLRNDGTVFSRIFASWDASTDIFVVQNGQIEIQFKKSSAETYEKWGFVGGEEINAYILDVEDGVSYDVRVRGINSLGYKSDWVEVTGHTVIGKVAPPENVPNVTVSQNGEAVLFRWGKVTDIDLSGYEIRYGLTSQSWEDMVVLTFATKGTQVTTVAVPPGTWKFCIKAVDTSLNESVTELCQVLTITNAQNVVLQKNQDNAWLGALKDYPYYKTANDAAKYFENTDMDGLSINEPGLSAGISIRVALNSGEDPSSGGSTSTFVSTAGLASRQGIDIYRRSSNGNLVFLVAYSDGYYLYDYSAVQDYTDYDICLTSDGAELNVYINGTLVATDTTRSGSPGAADSTLRIGMSADSTSQYCRGDVYLVASWNAIKTLEEMAIIHQQNLELHYAFDEPGASAVKDYSGSNKDLTAVGGLTVSDADRQSFINPFGSKNFHRNPLKGWLIPNDQASAADDNDDCFDNYIETPFDDYIYKEPELDLGRKDNTRVWIDTEYSVITDETGQPAITESLDYADDTTDYDGFEEWAIGFIDGRYFKFRLEMQNADAALAYITKFIPTFDVQERSESLNDISVGVGGTAVTFTKEFFNKPNVLVTMAEGGGKVPAAVNVTTTGFTLYVYDSSGVDVGGVVNWVATGA